MKTSGIIILVVAAWFFDAWAFMVTIGIVHRDWIHALPTIGYSTALLLGGIALMCYAIAAPIGWVLDDNNHRSRLW